jgi:hypothetical protein
MARPSTKATEVKEVEVIEEVKDVATTLEEKIESNIETAKANRTERKKVVLDDEDMIVVASYRGGTNRLENPKNGDLTVYYAFGDVEEIRYGTLKELKQRSGAEPFLTSLFVLDENAVEALGLKRQYEDLPHPTELPKLFKKPLQDIIKFIDNCGESTKQVLREILSDKIEKKEPIDYYAVKAIAEKLDYELNI